ncbi:MAG: DUF7698 family protein [Anaerovoracaceae bacterium]|jgi:hypothetical protein
MLKRIAEFDKAINENLKPKEAGMNFTLLAAYYQALQAGNDLPNFTEVIWDRDIEPIIEDCKKYGITEFTISSTFSGLITTIAEFEKRGCKLEGLTEVKATYTDWETREKEILPAFKMSIC